ncbi:MAG: RagB/SusD family nutrient uptake outer membrane protein [Leadbetterella sp.]
MKSNNIFLKSILASTVLFAGSCTDLTVEEKDSVVRSASGAWQPGKPDEMLVSAYKALDTYTDQAGIYSLGQHTSAEMIPPTRGVDWGDNGVWRTLDQHTWDANHSWIKNAWNALNQRVYNATDLIASNPSPLQKAQAQALRAYHMMHVMDYWGKVPFREVTQGPKDLPKVLSRSEAFDFIVKDLTEALPIVAKAGPSATNGVVNKAFVNFLLAKMHLNKAVYKAAKPEGPYTHAKEDMDKAIAYADAITADGYKIDPDYFNIFTTKSESEPIFVTLEGSPQNRWFMTLHYGQNPSGWNGFTTLADFYDKFDAADKRRGVPAKGDGKEFSGIGYGFLIGQQIDDKGKNIIDSRTNKPLAFTRDVPLAGAATDKGIRVIKYHPATAGKYILARYSEAVLMKAEAQLRGGNAAGALTTVNSIRTIRGASPLTALTENAMFDEIGRELYWEGGKRTVEVRFGKYLDGTGVVKKDASTLLFTIPSSAIVGNPNLAN